MIRLNNRMSHTSQTQSMPRIDKIGDWLIVYMPLGGVLESASKEHDAVRDAIPPLHARLRANAEGSTGDASQLKQADAGLGLRALVLAVHCQAKNDGGALAKGTFPGQHRGKLKLQRDGKWRVSWRPCVIWPLLQQQGFCSVLRNGLFQLAREGSASLLNLVHIFVVGGSHAGAR